MEEPTGQPLEGLLVIDLSQFLSGPSATLRLADLGARVVKVERPDRGDLCRRLYICDLELDGDSTLFHSINRNKESLSANLKSADDLKMVKQLLARADVVVQNFRPGVIERIGLGYDDVRQLNPRIVYATVSGYGETGPWRDKPGQDLLAQCLSGLPWLSGDRGYPPVPVGIAVADILAGAHLVQGILACLVRRGVTGRGGLVEVSLLESVLDFQFEALTTHLNDGGQPPRRAKRNSAHAYLAAPYGLYETADGYLAIAMGSVSRLGKLLALDEVARCEDPESWFADRDRIMALIAEHLIGRPTQYWLDILAPTDVWCAPLLTWEELLRHEGFAALDMLQTVRRDGGTSMRTTRCPVRIDGRVLKSSRGAPRIGQHGEKIKRELVEPLDD